MASFSKASVQLIKRPGDNALENVKLSNTSIRVIGHIDSNILKGKILDLITFEDSHSDVVKTILHCLVLGLKTTIQKNNAKNDSIYSIENKLINEADCIPFTYSLHLLQDKDGYISYMGIATFLFEDKSILGIAPIRFYASRALLGQSKVSLSTLTNSNTYNSEGIHDAELTNITKPILLKNRSQILDFAPEMFIGVEKKQDNLENANKVLETKVNDLMKQNQEMLIQNQEMMLWIKKNSNEVKTDLISKSNTQGGKQEPSEIESEIVPGGAKLEI